MSLTTELMTKLDFISMMLRDTHEEEWAGTLEEAIFHMQHLESDLKEARANIETFKSVLKEAQRG